MYNKHFVNFLVALLVLLIPACSSGEEDQPSSEPSAVVEGNLQVDRIDLVILESFPVQVRATLIGNLLDGCTTVGGTNISYADNQFMIEVTTTRPADAVCTEALVPFEQTVALDVLDLPAGDYTVVAGNAISVFNLAVDNKIQVPAETEERAPVANRIQGLVWHDVCAVAGGVNAEPAVPSEGCLQMEDGGFQANGVLTPDEPGIEGVEVVLRAVTCEGELLGSTLTDGDGRFAFENLDVGGYCVAVDPLENPNSGILIPGSWTSDLQGNAIVNLTTGQVVPDVNFGWDYQFLPDPRDFPFPETTPESAENEPTNEPDCVNKAAFVDETIEDDTIVAAGQDFTKTWILENTGTCRWSKEYAVVFVSGDKLGAPDVVNLPVKVPFGNEVTISVSMKAPQVAGTYRGEWKLQDENGNRFGLGNDGDKLFWVQIKVEGTVVDLSPELGNPDWRDRFTDSGNWFLLNTDNVRFSIENAGLRMRAKTANSGDFWGLSNQPDLKDFYIEGTFTTGPTCSGLDRYGLLIRAPNTNAGYVFNIACNGQFRVYEWDGQTYNQLQGWKTSTAIKTGPDATNRVGIWAEGDVLKLFVNDVQVVELDVAIYDQGQFGLLVGSANTDNFDVYVEELAYWLLKD